jgi:very-short-patch-repair endonuclease
MLRARRLLREATEAERKLWQQLQGKRLAGLKFRHQHRSAPYLAALCCLKLGLIIKHDGGQHTEQTERDAVRRAYLVQQGYHVSSFWHARGNREPTEVLEVIYTALPDM